MSSPSTSPPHPYRARRRHNTRRHKHPRNSKRFRPLSTWPLPNSTRLTVVLIFLLVLVYEVLILKGPLSKQSTPLRNFHTRPVAPDPPAQYPPPQHPPPPPPRPVSAADAPTVQERVRKAAAVTVGETADGDGNSLKEKSNAGYTPPLKRRVRKAIAEGGRAVGVKSKDNVRSNVKDALRIEMRPADADEDDDTSPAAGTASRRTGVTGGKSRRSHRRERKGDVEPPKPRVRSKVREGGGAEPGAGENFWQWFQETKGSEKKDVSNSVSCPEENMRLCLMFYKYIRKYKIRTIFDVSCGKNVHWMPDILKKVANELWGFKYYCGETDADALATAKEALGEQKFVEFVDDQWWRNGFPEDTELLFAWDTLPHIAYGRIWNFFVKARKQEIKYILVDNYPGILNDPSPKRNYLNLRKHPFRFPAAKEVVQNVTEPGETAKRQLLFYESSMLPDNLQ